MRNDYAEIAFFAHWLKGSAGTMGYDAFSAPAIALETAAKDADGEQVERILNELRHMSQRVVPPQETTAAA